MIDDWFPRFVCEHWTLHARAGLLPPEDSDQFAAVFAALRESFDRRGVREYAWAAAASRRLLTETLPHSSHHFPRLVELALEARRQREARLSGLDPDSFEAARFASESLRGGLGCEWCDNLGQTAVYHRAPDFGRGAPATAGAHCVCPAGRWLRQRVSLKDPSSRRGVVDLAEVLACRGPWLLSPPGAAATEPETVPDGMAMLKSLVASHSVSRRDRRGERAAPVGAAEIAFARDLSPAERERFLALPGPSRSMVLRCSADPDPVLAREAARLLGRAEAPAPATPEPPP